MEPKNEYGGVVYKPSDFKPGAVASGSPSSQHKRSALASPEPQKQKATAEKSVHFAPPAPPWRYRALRQRREARKVGDQLDQALTANIADKAARAEAEKNAFHMMGYHHKGLQLLSEEELAAHREELRQMRVTVAETKAMEHGISKQGVQHLTTDRALRDMESIHKWTRASRDKLSTLDDLETRVKKLLTRLNGPPTRNLPPAADEVAQELDALDIDDRVYIKCSLCGKRFMKGYLAHHERSCIPTDEPSSGSDDDGGESVDAEPIEVTMSKKDAKAAKALKKRELEQARTLEPCTICGRRYKKDRLEKHMKDCARKQLLKAQKVAKSNAERQKRRKGFPTLKPQPPQQVSLVAATCSTLTVQWLDPIFDGGTPIFDYEVVASFCHKERIGKKVIRTPEQVVQTRTTRWCNAVPVVNAFTIRDLAAASEYVDIRVRAYNQVGVSDWSDPLESAWTKELEPPSVPLHLELAGPVTSSTIKLRWKQPHESGGAPRLGYEIHFRVEVQLPVVGIGFGAEGGVEQQPKVLVIPPGIEEYTMTLLNGDTTYSRLCIKAFNAETGSRSKSSNMLPDLHTLVPTRLQVVEDEIRKAEESKYEFVDSDVLQGFKQRYRREELIEKLEVEAARLIEEGAGYEERKARQKKSKLFGDGSDSDAPDGDDEATRQQQERERQAHDMLGLHKKTVRIKRGQFRKKMAMLQATIDESEAKIARLNRLRLDGNEKLRKMDQRIRKVDAELSRAKTFRGAYMDTTALHGEQRFEIKALRLVLQKELDELHLAVAKIKHSMITANKLEVDLRAKIEQSAELLKERQAALANFEAEVAKRAKTIGVVARLLNAAAHHAFRRWVVYLHMRRKEKDLMRKTIMRMQHSQLLKGWSPWLNMVEQQRALERKLHTDKKTDKLPGMGSVMLSANERQLVDTQKEIRDVLDSLVPTEGTLERTKRSVGQVREYTAGVARLRANGVKPAGSVKDGIHVVHRTIMRRAEVAVANRDFTLALELIEQYNAAAWKANNLPALSHAYKLIVHIFESQGLAQHDKFMIAAERWQSIAHDASEYEHEGMAIEAQARGMGRKYNYRRSLKKYEVALDHWSSIRDDLGKARAYRGMQSCLESLHEPFRAAEFGELARQREEAVTDQVRKVRNTLHSYENKLVGATLRMANTVSLERVSATMPWARSERLRIKQAIVDNQTHQVKTFEKMDILEARLDALDKELRKAKRCKDPFIDSSLIHGASQRFQPKVLVANLEREIGKDTTKLKKVVRHLKNAVVRQSNFEDDLKEVEAVLVAEEGALVRRVQEKRRIRAVCLNPNNFTSNDVTGEATGGVAECAVAVETSIYVYNIQTGRVLRVYQGDSEFSRPGTPWGHTRTIVCLYYFGEYIYSGALDGTCRVWYSDPARKVEKKAKPARKKQQKKGQVVEKEVPKAVFTLIGHEEGTSVWSVVADEERILTGGSDARIIAWHPKTGKLLRRIRGHEASIMDIRLGAGCFITGSIDQTVRIWDHEGDDANPFKRVSVRMRMVGPGTGITQVHMAGSEVITGHVDGMVHVWNAELGEVTSSIQAHEKMITCMACDSTRIVTGSSDTTTTIHEISSGDVLQTLRGHESHILAVQYDVNCVLTASSDATLRFWEWEGKRHKGDRVKRHAFGPGDTVASVAARYGISPEQLKSWNEIKDVKRMYEGMSLIVKIVGKAPKKAAKKPLPEPDPNLRKMLTKRNANRHALGKKLSRWQKTGSRRAKQDEAEAEAARLEAEAEAKAAEDVAAQVESASDGSGSDTDDEAADHDEDEAEDGAAGGEENSKTAEDQGGDAAEGSDDDDDDDSVEDAPADGGGHAGNGSASDVDTTRAADVDSVHGTEDANSVHEEEDKGQEGGGSDDDHASEPDDATDPGEANAGEGGSDDGHADDVGSVHSDADGNSDKHSVESEGLGRGADDGGGDSVHSGDEESNHEESTDESGGDSGSDDGSDTE